MRMFGLRRDELTGSLRKLHSEEFIDLYSTLNSIMTIEKGGEVGGGT